MSYPEYIPDYNDYATQEDNKRASLEDKLPKCDLCGEPIYDDYCYEINGEVICEECLKEHYRHETENYMD